ncbi:MAG: glycoside hydrolase family 78 protein, partial [Bacteroidaceae bacterium]|nr:glycoside hydrolase family 78 protein [Bacteroidaceae bacterium]
MKYVIALYLMAFTLLATSCSQKAKVTSVHQQVELLTNPLGIDVVVPRFSWVVQCQANEVRQTGYHILVSSSKEKLHAGIGDLWDSGEVASDSSAFVTYKGQPLNSRQQVYWKVKLQTNRGASEWSTPNTFSMGLLQASDWKGQWIGHRPFPVDHLSGHTVVPARYLRTEFNVASKDVSRATLYISGLGLYEAYLNAQRIGQQQLAPGPTNYNKEVKYNTFDVTQQIISGHNAIGVVLGNGRWVSMRMPGQPSSKDVEHYGVPQLLLQLEVEYADGTTQVICTDDTWKLSVDGPIQANNEFDGEIYDANKEMPGWTQAGFDASMWMPVETMQAPKGTLTAQMNPNICVMDTLHPVAIHAVGKDAYVLDMGQNMVGWVQMKVKGQSGDKITLHFAETLQADSTLYTANLRYSEPKDEVILKDSQPFTWHPVFVYHGFRYVQVKGLSYQPSLTDFEGHVLYDEMATTGTFESSNDTLNKIYANATWGIRGNYRGMPTDCPQRDERMGWLGDRTTGCYGESYVFNNHHLYAKWLNDIAAEQNETGSLPDVAPAFWDIRSDNMTWPGAFLTVADMLYERYGDVQPILQHYPAMQKWLAYMKATYAVDGIITKDTYGDWCMPPERPELIHSQDPSRITAPGVISTAYYYHFCQLMSKFAALQGLSADEAFYQQEAQTTQAAFNKKYYNPEEGYYDNNTVTANLLPLRFGMVSESERQRVIDNIIRTTVNDFGSHVSTGVVGIQQLMRGLTDNGYGELALQIATSTTYPSWGYMVANGATTIWELWNGNTADPAMNSGNHVMLLGDLVIWLYDYLAGIAPASPGFKEVQMRPTPIPGLQHVNATYQSVYGLIKSAWRKEGNTFQWDITIPSNTTAQVYVPCPPEGMSDKQKIKIQNMGTRYVGQRDGYAVFVFPSGHYSILIM